jgi:hypothetical protein
MPRPTLPTGEQGSPIRCDNPQDRCWDLASPLIFGERRDELSAEGGDVWDHAAPDQVGNGAGTSAHVSKGLLEWSANGSPLAAGVSAGMPREEGGRERHRR